jgi:type I restriction enzyme S subunit
MDYSKYQLVEPGDFAMNHMDLLTGYVDLSEVHGVTSPDYRVFTLRNRKTCSDRYFLYLLQNAYNLHFFYPYGQGASQLGRWRLPTEQFNNFLFPFPPLKDQSAIAGFLDAEIARVDAIVEDCRHLAELMNEEVASLVFSFMDLASSQEMRLGGAARLIPRPVTQKEGELYTPIGLFNRGRGLFHKRPREMDEMGDSDFFWVEEGDLIISGQFAWEGAVALAGKEDSGCVVSHRYHVLRGISGIAHTEYLLALLSTKHGDFLLNENSRGAAGRNRPLNITSLLKEKIRVPDLQAQEKVAKAVHERDRMFRETSKQVHLLQEYRFALISAAVTGQIDVRTHNPQEAAATHV